MYYRDYYITYKWYRNGNRFVIDCDGCKMGFDTQIKPDVENNLDVFSYDLFKIITTMNKEYENYI